MRPVPDHPENPFNPITEGDPRSIRPPRSQREQAISDQYRESNDKKYLRPAEREVVNSLQNKYICPKQQSLFFRSRESSMAKLLSGQGQPFVGVRTSAQRSPSSLHKSQLAHLLNYDYAPDQLKKQVPYFIGK